MFDHFPQLFQKILTLWMFPQFQVLKFFSLRLRLIYDAQNLCVGVIFDWPKNCFFKFELFDFLEIGFETNHYNVPSGDRTNKW